jgi:hypothetical protein
MSIDGYGYGYGYGYIQVDFKRIERYYRLPIKVLLHAIEHANNCYNNNCNELKCAHFMQDLERIKPYYRYYDHMYNPFYELIAKHAENCSHVMCEIPHCLNLKHFMSINEWSRRRRFDVNNNTRDCIDNN